MAELICPMCSRTWTVPEEVPEHLRDAAPCPVCLRPIYDDIVAEVHELAGQIDRGEIDAPPGDTAVQRAMYLMRRKYVATN